MKKVLTAACVVWLAAFVSTVQARSVVGPFEYQRIEGASPEPSEGGAKLTDRVELEAFFDGVMTAHLRAQHIAGATVAVVKDGELLLAKGYGHAHLEHDILVEADRTLFRPGSVSKLLTWTALMQQVEQGKVDLDADVNTYLTQFKVPDTYPGYPITPRNLLTHTAGTEDGGAGYLIVDSVDRMDVPHEALAKHMPARIHPPTTEFDTAENSSYSNWSTSLAGLIVANVSGMSFDDYIEKNVLEPLGMTNSTFRQPLPAALAEQMAEGYAYEAGAFVAKGFEYINFGPAGALSATATDMARFMIAHLNDGALGDTRILQPDTARLMHARMLSPSSYLNGSGLGFYENYINGRRLLVHAGDTLYFHSELNLLLDERVGVFVSVNTAPTLPFSTRTDLMRAFMDRYYPARLPHVDPPADFQQRAHRFAGSYRINRHSHTTHEKLFGLLDAITVAPTADDTLMLNLASATEQYVEVAPAVFRRVLDDKMIGFHENDRGEVDYLLNPGSLVFMGAYKLAWWETPGILGLVIAFAMLTFVIAIVSALRHWKHDRQASSSARLARRLAAVVAVLNLVFLMLMGVSLLLLTKNPLAALPSTFDLALALPLISSPLTLGLCLLVVLAWRRGFWTRYGRVQYSLIAAGSTAFVCLLGYANLLGYYYG